MPILRSENENVISERCESSDSVRKPCAMLPPKADARARRGSTWIHWKSSTALAKVSMRSWVISIQGEIATSSPTRCSRSRRPGMAVTFAPSATDRAARRACGPCRRGRRRLPQRAYPRRLALRRAPRRVPYTESFRPSARARSRTRAAARWRTSPSRFADRPSDRDRLPRAAGPAALRPAKLSSKTFFCAARDRLGQPALHGGILHAALFVAVDDHAGLYQHRRHGRAAADREVVVEVHAVDLVREGPVLAEDRVGMIARGGEAGGAQLGADGARAGEAFLRLRIEARDEQREAREALRIGEVSLSHGIVVDREEQVRAARLSCPVSQTRMGFDHADFESGGLERAPHLDRELAVELELRPAACRNHARLPGVMADVDRHEQRGERARNARSQACASRGTPTSPLSPRGSAAARRPAAPPRRSPPLRAACASPSSAAW